MKDKYKVLKDQFGYLEFREGQEMLIDNILSGKDTVGIMPTGAGKSLCFQIPALLFEGITLVISPLISLMKDQVNALTQSGIKAAYINSSLTSGQYRKVLENAYNNRYKIIYIAPERLLTEGFKNFSNNSLISMVSIDEAHCVSQWGQDFRPSYLKIVQFIDMLKYRPVVSAFTATATQDVKDDIIEILKLKSPLVVTTGFNRKNLYFEVQKPTDKFIALKNFLHRNNDKSGIVYCLTRKMVEEVCKKLCESGYKATRYHAGLLEAERTENQDDFLYDKKQIMVATNAFGMGIDKSNISFVIHYNMPKNIESYYQEAGRAGRDGEPAECILFYSGKDVVTNQFMIEQTNENEDIDAQTASLVKEKDRERLKAITYYCHTNDCLREYILRYFGDIAENFCGNCSNCNTNFEETDITIDAQKIMSCIKRSGERFGIKVITDTLRGSESERIINLGLNQLSTYAIMAKVKEKKIREIINFLALHGYIDITNKEYPIIKLNLKSKEVLLNQKKLKMKICKDIPKATINKTDDIKLNENEELFERLKKLRGQIAASQRVASYIIFSDASLRDMCKKRPRNADEFLEVSGVGQVKLKKYGKKFLSAIKGI